MCLVPSDSAAIAAVAWRWRGSLQCPGKSRRPSVAESFPSRWWADFSIGIVEPVEAASRRLTQPSVDAGRSPTESTYAHSPFATVCLLGGGSLQPSSAQSFAAMAFLRDTQARPTAGRTLFLAESGSIRAG